MVTNLEQDSSDFYKSALPEAECHLKSARMQTLNFTNDIGQAAGVATISWIDVGL